MKRWNWPVIAYFTALCVIMAAFGPRRCFGQGVHVRLLRVEPYRPHEIVLATTAVTFALLDYSTTMDAVLRCEPYGTERKCYHGTRECVEGNPLIGCFPSPWKLRAMSLAGVGLELGVGSLLRGWKRSAWYAAMTVVSFTLVKHNVSSGFRITVKL